MELLGQRAGVHLALVDIAKSFSKMAVPFGALPATQESSGLTKTCEHFFFHFSHPGMDGCMWELLITLRFHFAFP